MMEVMTPYLKLVTYVSVPDDCSSRGFKSVTSPKACIERELSSIAQLGKRRGLVDHGSVLR
jgi:hypothetical protein